MSEGHSSGNGGWASPDPDEDHDQPLGGWSAPKRTSDLNVVETLPLVSPRQICQDLPITPPAHRCIVESRDAIHRILGGFDHRLLAVVGPCSIHDEKGAIEYAERLLNLSRRVADRLLVVMRVYFEKPRTTIGWKGLINDPYLDGSFAMETGIRIARQLLLTIAGMGLPTATEMLDPITPQYIADLISWASLGAKWPAACPCPSASKTPPKATSKSRSTPCSPPAIRIASSASMRRAELPSSTPEATAGDI